ncbi:MAG TPA: hypothetical protein VEO54_04000 [Thermoanaerobaculia bacterium]|nr:hypothetical protein [Thermoanaerobaculia bacterium]
MERMETRDYRLERWLAVLLSLLFFLPFVAKADDILFANVSYHGDEMPYRNGEEFLALTHDGVLAPVRIQVKREHDPIVDNEGEVTGKHVAVPGFEEYTLLLRGRKLNPGKVVLAEPDSLELEAGVTKATIALGRTTSHVYYRCSDTECTFVLETGGVSQDLFTVEAERRGKEIFAGDLSHAISVAGDFDHDGKLDLVMNAATHWNESRPTLFLSTSAKGGKLVGKAAEIVMTGC